MLRSAFIFCLGSLVLSSVCGCSDGSSETCDNGLDDDTNGKSDCLDATCGASAYCNPASFTRKVDALEAPNSSMTIVMATDLRGREARLYRVVIDGQPLSGDPDSFVEQTVGEGAASWFGVTAGSHHVTLELGGSPVWDFGNIEFTPQVPQTLIAYGGLSDPQGMAFEQRDVAENEAVGRVINVWDTREPFDVLLCPQQIDSLDACTLVREDLAYGEFVEVTADPADGLSLVWERQPLEGMDGRYFDFSEPIGATYCVNGPYEPIHEARSTVTMMLPLSVSLAQDCYGCKSGFELLEPFPLGMVGVQGACE